jgi:ring-1,2-phenylacetyl-CoA epoxidase subunit PaaC
VLLVEQPNGDFALTILRQLFFAAFAHPYFQKLAHSQDQTLAAIAAKAEKEMAYHLRHAAEWAIRLGDGTDESHRRAQDAVDELMPYTGELFESDQIERTLIETGVAPEPASVRPLWDDTIDKVLMAATLTRPRQNFVQTGGRSGKHSEHLGHLLAELQFLQRAYPGATW